VNASALVLELGDVVVGQAARAVAEASED